MLPSAAGRRPELAAPMMNSPASAVQRFERSPISDHNLTGHDIRDTPLIAFTTTPHGTDVTG
jgi:hypothetical protein